MSATQETRRLFLFAGYDSQGIIGQPLEYYIRAVSEYGDIVFVTDNSCPEAELNKLEGLVLHSEASRHGEYDFGSYKRAYMWAAGNLDLTSYDFCYLINDSVYGPLYRLGPYLERMENLGTDAFALVMNPHRDSPHLQSWFIGMNRQTFLSREFSDFIISVTGQEDKTSVCIIYETGLTQMLHGCGFSYDGLYHIKGRRIYNRISPLYRKGLPFFKKAAMTRHGGSLGKQVRSVLGNISPALRRAIVADMDRLYGKGYADRFLSGGDVVMFLRYVRYLCGKIKINI